MSYITKIDLYVHSEELKKCIESEGILLEDICGYGWVCNQSAGASAALNLLITKDIDQSKLKKIQDKLSEVFREQVEIDTFNTLNKKVETINEINFQLPTEIIKNIEQQRVTLKVLLQEGENQYQQAETLEKRIISLNFAQDINLDKLTKEQTELLVELGFMYHELSDILRLGNNIISYMKKNSKIKHVIEYAQQWNIYTACANKDLAIVKSILEIKKEFLNLPDKRFGNTPLHIALINNASNIVSFLIEQKADVNIANGKNKTPQQFMSVDEKKSSEEKSMDSGSEYLKNISFFRSEEKKSEKEGKLENIYLVVSRKELENKEDEIIPQIKGLVYQKIPKDGDCLFNAVGLHVNQDQQMLRNLVAARIEKEEELKSFLTLTQEKSVEKYLKDLREGKEWADHVEITVLMKLLDRPIVIIWPDGSIKNRNEYENYGGEPIFVYYNGHDHYDAFLLTGEYQARDILNDRESLIIPSNSTSTQLSEYSLELGGELLESFDELILGELEMLTDINNENTKKYLYDVLFDATLTPSQAAKYVADLESAFGNRFAVTYCCMYPDKWNDFSIKDFKQAVIDSYINRSLSESNSSEFEKRESWLKNHANFILKKFCQERKISAVILDSDELMVKNKRLECVSNESTDFSEDIQSIEADQALIKEKLSQEKYLLFISKDILSESSVLLKLAPKSKLSPDAIKLSLSDPCWKSIYNLVKQTPTGLIRPENKMLKIIRAVLYKEINHCSWRELPQWSFPGTTVRHYYYQWRNEGILSKIETIIDQNFKQPATTMKLPLKNSK